jgi:hypothetical protein
MISVPPHLAQAIQRRIDEMEADRTAGSGLHLCTHELNALPTLGNQIYVWALRADGMVLCMDHEAFLHPVDEVYDPRTVHAVLADAARRYPELRELVPARPPPGVLPCEACGTTGWIEETKSGCSACEGLGWRMQPRPIDEWMDRIDRGDHLHLAVDPGMHGLAAGRLAGFYVAREGKSEPWIAPVDARSRRKLSERLRGYGPGRHVTAWWRPNESGFDDPFESPEHLMRFFGTGTGGSYQVDIARRSDGRYTMTETLNNDFDPMWSGEPTHSTKELDEAQARAAVEREMRDSSSFAPFPAIVPRSSS